MTPTIRVFDVSTPLGTMRGAATPTGLALLAFPGSDFDGPLARLRRGLGVRPETPVDAGRARAGRMSCLSGDSTPSVSPSLTGAADGPPGRGGRSARRMAITSSPAPRGFLAGPLAADVRTGGRLGSAVARQLSHWFEGRRRTFDVALDLSLASGFAADVLSALGDVPFGELVTYGELARRAGRPRAARAVGRAVGDNPVPIIVP